MMRWQAFVVAVAVAGTATAWAATVTKIDPVKVLLEVDTGSDIAFVKDAKACVYDDAGKKIGCGKILRAKGAKATVKFTKKKIDLVKEGNEVKIEAGTDTSVGVASKRSDIKVGYLPTLLPPATFQKLSYVKHDNQAVNTLWKKTGPTTLSFFGAAAEAEFGLSSISFATGLRYTLYRDFKAESDYSKTDAKLYGEVVEKGSTLGFWLDTYFLNVRLGQTLTFKLGAGLDFDKSAMTFVALQRSDEGGSSPLAKASSQLTVVSLRINTPFEMVFTPGGFGLNFGLHLMIPMVATGARFSGEVSDSAAIAAMGTNDPVADLKTSLDHKKSSFAAQLFLALSFGI